MKGIFLKVHIVKGAGSSLFTGAVEWLELRNYIETSVLHITEFY